MSRRSLRLDDGLLDRSLPYGSASYSVGGVSWRSSRSLKSHRSQQLSASCSDSLLLHTPLRPPLLTSSLHSVASDASLVSSLLDDSSIQESTLVNSFWGLDHDVDPTENVVVGDQSSEVVNSSLIGSEGSCGKHPVQSLSRVYCRGCEPLSDRKESVHVYGSSSSSALRGPEPADPETSTIYCRGRGRKSRTARCVRGGVMSLKEVPADPTELRPSLCDDCKEKQRSETDASLTSCLLGFMWSVAALTASSLAQLVLTAASAVVPLSKDVCSASWSSGRSAGRAAGGALRWLCRRWCHMTAGLHLPLFPLRFVLVVLPLLLILFGLCWFSPAGLQSVLPAVNITAWRTAVSDVPVLSDVHSFVSSHSQSAEEEESREGQPDEEVLYSRPAPTGGEEAAALDSERLVGMETSLAALWERMEAGGRREEQRHQEVLQLYADLQLSSARSDGGGVQSWTSVLLDQQLSRLRRRLDEDRRQRDRVRRQDMLHHQSQTVRLDQLELQMQTLAARTEEVQQRGDATTDSPSSTTAVSIGVDRLSHDALRSEVAQLEAAVEDVRRDIDGLSGCQDGCQQLTAIQETISGQVSAQVREEVRALVYGNQLTAGGDAGLPRSLLQWLSQRYVSAADLQGALVSLQRSVLDNVNLQLEQRCGEEAVREGTGVTLEDVQVTVTDALRRFSEDRTGLVDFALESGGGSVLSTRCSETYETKAAMLSLFGVPLWYFSQSPRAVIQPDVHPGNCWAFRGSKGFLVLRLSMRIRPSSVSLEHLPKNLAPSGTRRSAPRDFSVYGLGEDGEDGGTLLGRFTYEQDGDALQTYAVSEENHEAFQVIEVQVLSNWGHLEYTCMYRFRVHGTPV
ncbi:SUN domain-containing protein 1-like [Brachyistius frenatus]|uniref:SUN domain-containing protein 1-like n=1 Tax=Brachyistius frenatus TaxID=100188 RepID=UPI0037E94E92